MRINTSTQNIEKKGEAQLINTPWKHIPTLARIFFVAIMFFLCRFGSAQTGTWTAVTNLAPHANMGVMLLLTDGTVICHNSNGGTYGTGWDKLTPSATGSYANGTWTSITSMNNNRLFFSSQVLPSGKVYVAGGEYGPGGTKGEVYDPVTNTWTNCGAIPGGWNIYDGNSQLLYTGNVLEGPQIGSASSYNILQWSPTTLNYTTEANAPLNHDEAEWVKLPDSSVLYVGIASQNSCRYLPKTNTWLSDAGVPVKIFDQYGEESGCGFMLPNGKAIFFGATEYNAIYTPTGTSTPGSWAAAADFPTIGTTLVGQPDASGAMMVNGHILLAVSPLGTSSSDEFRTPTYFVEYNYVTNTFTQVTSTIPTLGADSMAGVACFQTNMLDLPDGNVLVSLDQAGNSNQYWVYTPGSAAIAQGKPTINSILPDGCPSYKITGKLFNGISEGAAYGDDWQMSTNWPLVRLTNGGNVFYAKTTNWNRIGAVQTDSAEDTAVFTPPATLTPGTTYSLVVVVNGFASSPTLFTTLGISMASHTNVSCHGGTGTATANAAIGGISPYTYSWAPSGGTNLTATVTAGSYTITVTDHNGCTATASATITQPTALAVTASVTSEVHCNGGNNGSVSSTPSGGTTPYTYSWTGGGTNSTETGLSIGTYTITLRDNNGCTATASATITQPTVLNVTASVTSEVSCNGGNNGSVSSSTSGGTNPYTYSWSGGGTNSTKTGLSSGTYTITVEDNNGCSASASATITQPTLLSVIANVTTEVTCNGGSNGSLSSSPSGGISPYTYSWSGGGTNSTKTGLPIGTYTITVKDNNGCTATASATITQPPTLSVTASVASEASCNGSSNGSVSSSPSGGTSPYTYSWTGGGTNATETGLSAGTYTITLRDNCGALATASITITQPTPLVVSANVTSNVGCTGSSTGSVSATPGGGTAPYTYLWTGGGTNATDTLLLAGSYTITLQDNNGCTATASATITQPATALAIHITSQKNITCNGEANGSASAAVSGGTSPYIYSWAPGGGTNLTVSNLSAGTYTITATDNNGCVATASATITQPSALVVTSDSLSTTIKPCNGQASVTVNGGKAPYTYSWSPGGATTDTIKGQCTGDYCCTITDNNGCTKSTCVIITNNTGTGIESISNSFNINIYPDPNTGAFTVSGLIQGQMIELYNDLGQKLNSSIADNTTMYFDISTKPDGVYLVRILSKDGTLATQKKIIKTK